MDTVFHCSQNTSSTAVFTMLLQRDYVPNWFTWDQVLRDMWLMIHWCLCMRHFTAFIFVLSCTSVFKTVFYCLNYVKLVKTESSLPLFSYVHCTFLMVFLSCVYSSYTPKHTQCHLVSVCAVSDFRMTRFIYFLLCIYFSISAVWLYESASLV